MLASANGEATKVKTGTISYFITGFPRSRLAWLSNYLTYDNSICLFDGLKHGIKAQDFGFLDDFHGLAEVVGIADSGLPIYQDTMIEKYPKAKWVLIERDCKDSKQAIKNLGINPGNTLATLSVKMDELRGRVNVLRVPYESLDEAVLDVAKFINPAWKHNQVRHEMLLGFNVQYDPELGKKFIQEIPRDNLLSRRAEPPTPTATNAEAIRILIQICEGQPSALKFLLQSVEAALVWDHVVDGDTIDIDSTNRIFEKLLTEWPINEFIINNAKSLTPVMAAVIAKWKNGDRRDHYSVYIDLASAVAFIIGGMDRVNAFIPRLAKLLPILIEEDDKRDRK